MMHVLVVSFWAVLTFTFISTQSSVIKPTISNSTGTYYIGDKSNQFASKRIDCNPLKHCHILCNASEACASTKIYCSSSLCDLQCLSLNSCSDAQFTVNISTASVVTLRCEASHGNQSYAPCNGMQISANADSNTSASFYALYNSTHSASLNSTINLSNFSNVTIARYDCTSCDNTTDHNVYNFTSVNDVHVYCDHGACAYADVLSASSANLNIHCNGSESCQHLRVDSLRHHSLTLNCSDINSCTRLNISTFSSSDDAAVNSNTRILCQGVDDDNGMNDAFFTCYKSKITSIGGDVFELLATAGHLSHSHVLVNDTRRLNLTCLNGCSKSAIAAHAIDQTNLTLSLANEILIELRNNPVFTSTSGAGNVSLDAYRSYNGQFIFSDFNELWITKNLGAENIFNLSNISMVSVTANSSALYEITDSTFWMDAVGNVTLKAISGVLQLIAMHISEADNLLITNDESIKSYFSNVDIFPQRIHGNLSVRCFGHKSKDNCQLQVHGGDIKDSLHLECNGYASCDADMRIEPHFVGNLFNVTCVGNGSCDGVIDAREANHMVVVSSASKKTNGVYPRILTPTLAASSSTTKVLVLCLDYGCFDLNVSTTNGVRDMKVVFDGECKCDSVEECIGDWRVQCKAGEARIQSGNCSGECCDGFDDVRNAFSQYYRYGCAPAPSPEPMITPKQFQRGLLIAVLVIVIIGFIAGCSVVYFGRKRRPDEKQQIMLQYSEEPSPSIN